MTQSAYATQIERLDTAFIPVLYQYQSTLAMNIILNQIIRNWGFYVTTRTKLMRLSHDPDGGKVLDYRLLTVVNIREIGDCSCLHYNYVDNVISVE